MATATASTLVDPHALRLDDARALLEHGGDSARLPRPGDSPTAYLQAVIDALQLADRTEKLKEGTNA